MLSVEDEAVIVAFRKHTLLALDDCLYALQSSIPHLTRSSLHRCLQRHGISRLPDVEDDKPGKRKFKSYPIGYFHIDIAEVRTAEGRLYLFVAIDRTSKFAFTELHAKATTKIHALTDDRGRPCVLQLTPGNTHDVMKASDLIAAAGRIRRLIADKAYDSNRLRAELAAANIVAVIPSIARRKPLITYNRKLYRQRNLIERMFARLKDFRRIATRYDKLARNFLSAVKLAAILIWWT